MKKEALLLALLLPVLSAAASAQQFTLPPVAPAPAALATVSGTASDTLSPADWLKIGQPFGNRSQWQVGFDKSATIGNCAAYAVRAKFLMAGPCRDVLLLAKDARPVFHLGGAALYSASHQPGYFGRVGFNVGPAAASVLNYAADRIPYVEAVSSWKAPAPLAYLGKVSTFDYSVGTVNGQFDHGPQVKVDVPLEDLRAALGF